MMTTLKNMPEDNQQHTPQSDQPHSPEASARFVELEDTGSINQLATPAPTYQPAQEPVRKPSRWRYFFIILGILQAVGVGLFFLIMAWAVQQAKAGMSGTEFIGLLVYVTLVPAVGLIAFINLVGLPIYMIKNKLRGKGLIPSILSLAISAILAFYGAYTVYEYRVAVPKQMEQRAQQYNQQIQAQEQQYISDNAKPEITKDEAVALLNSCQLRGFYYTNQTNKSDGEWGELSSTGVVLTKVNGQPYRISIADSLAPELVPVARQAQAKCGGQPQFWHNGNYE